MQVLQLTHMEIERSHTTVNVQKEEKLLQKKLKHKEQHQFCKNLFFINCTRIWI